MSEQRVQSAMPPRPGAQPNSAEETRYIGVVTRSVSWIIDAIVINAVAVGAGIGVSLFFSVFPISRHHAANLKPVLEAVYLVWTAAYFVGLWTILGQTMGARVMRIRVVTAGETRVKPVRAFVRWIGMNLAMLPLFLGFAPILFGRRGFPDWLAHTLVIDAPSSRRGRQPKLLLPLRP
jgi:uncharacterized RDD family membrane protein YckC